MLALLPEDHAALTAQVQPTLYWYLPEATDASIVVQIWGDDGDEPLFERRSEGGALAGFHAVPLEDTSVRLESGRDYRWYVVGIANRERPQEYTFSGGTVRRVALPAGVEPDEARSDTASELARKGLWCDALHLAFIEDEGKARGVQPGSRVWALLQQVGITAHLEGAVSLEVR